MKPALFALTTLLLGLSAAPASAQYYAPPPRYPPPPYGYAPPPLGGRCDAFLRTPYGPQRQVCPLYRPRPVGARCECPPPAPYAPPFHGHVIP